MKLPPLQNRAAILLFFLFLWAALVAAHLFFYTVIGRDEYIKRGNVIAMREGRIPAQSGSLLDKNGMRIAWTVIWVDLCFQGSPEDPFYRSELQKKIREFFPDFNIPAGEEKRCLIKKISPRSQFQLLPLLAKFPELTLERRKERQYISEEIKEYLQKTGIEECTKGKDGIFKVMVDRRGNWIPGTWEEKIPPLNGKDLKLELTIEELWTEAGLTFPKEGVLEIKHGF